LKPRPRAKAKAKRSQEDVVAHQLRIFNMATKARYKLAMRAFDAQDDKTKDALLLMVERLRSLSTGQIRIWPNGRREASIVVPIEPEQIDQNLMYLATEILKDLSLFDIKVANYEFPPSYCIECGDKLKPSKRERLVKRR